MNRSYRWFSLVLCLSVLLAACGSKESDEGSDATLPPLRLPTVAPQLDAVRLPGCETADFESWFEVVSANLSEFTTTSLAALDHPADQLGSDFNRLYNLRDAIAAQPVPEDCALELRGQIMGPVNAILLAYQQYINGESTADDWRAAVESSVALLNNEVAAALAGAQGQLESQLQQQNAHRTATPPG